MEKDEEKYYDLIVVGGGLAGLTTAILVARSGYRVLVFEKESYPFHKVCGEYISLESRDLLMSLGLALDEWDLPLIKNLVLTSAGGAMLRQELPLGGFGLSRFRLDDALAGQAKKNGVELRDGTRVHDILFEETMFSVIAEDGVYHARLCCGAFGKRSGIDVKWNRKFIRKKAGALNNYIAVKYHARLSRGTGTIELHNFPGGYCGVSAVEDDKTCICYLTTAQNLRRSGNNIRKMEKEALFRNTRLKAIFSRAEFLYARPLTISQISFDRKEQVMEHVLLAGDAAGMITPLCGNGMSMALFGGKMAAEVMTGFLGGAMERQAMEEEYVRRWRRMFDSRLKAGRRLQGLFARDWMASASLQLLRHFPGLVKKIIRSTHAPI